MPLPMEESVQQFSAAPRGARTSRTLSWTPCRLRTLRGTRPRERPHQRWWKDLCCAWRGNGCSSSVQTQHGTSAFRTSPLYRRLALHHSTFDRREAGKGIPGHVSDQVQHGAGALVSLMAKNARQVEALRPRVHSHHFRPRLSFTVTTRIPAIVVKISKSYSENACTNGDVWTGSSTTRVTRSCQRPSRKARGCGTSVPGRIWIVSSSFSSCASRPRNRRRSSFHLPSRCRSRLFLLLHASSWSSSKGLQSLLPLIKSPWVMLCFLHDILFQWMRNRGTWIVWVCVSLGSGTCPWSLPWSSLKQ